MQIVINISDSIYKDLQLGIGVGVVLKLEDIVVLPKGHGRLIDEDILHGRLRDSYLDSFGLMRVEKVLENMDAVIEADGGAE